MNKGKTTSTKHHERRRTSSVKVRRKSSIIKDLPIETAPTIHVGVVKRAVPKSNGNGAKSPSLIIHDMAEDGLKAFTHLMEQLQSDSGATLLFAHHLKPEHHQQLTELLLNDSKKETAEAVQNLRKELATTEENLKQRTTEVTRLGDVLVNVLGAIQDPLIVVGRDLKLKRCSPAAVEVLGFSEDDIGRAVTSTNIAGQMPNLQAIISKVIATSNEEEQEVVDDRGRWYLLSAQPYMTSDGKVEGAVVSFRDIDANKQGDALLRTYQLKEQNYHDIVNGILMVIDAQGSVMMMNRSGCELLGLDEATIIGRNWIDEFVPRSHWPVARTMFEQAIDGELSQGYEYPVVTKGGEERVISWRSSLLKDQTGIVTGMICSGEDLTLLRQINNALQKSEERFHLMMESVREDEFFIMDSEGYIISWIARPEEGKSYRAQEMVGQHFSCLYAPDDFQSGKPMRILSTAETEGRFEEDGWRVRKDGTRMRAYVIILPIRDESRNLLGFSNVTRYMRERPVPEETARILLPLEHVEKR